MFVDEINVFARAGHGGRGCISFLREAYRPKGGPDGGNGGRGGSVILEADHDLNNLVQQFYQPRLIAEGGGHGMGKGMDGRAGRDLIIKVPCGTLVWRIPPPPGSKPPEESESPGQAPDSSEEDDTSNAPPLLGSSLRDRPVIRHAGGHRAMEIDLSAEEPSDPAPAPRERELVCDLTTHGQRWVLCKGGRGGLGNSNFATAARQTPRFAQPGEPGEEGHFHFELRLLAEVGLVGYPNAGKSTLLAAISHARPKIAAYPFTTLTPQIGIIEYADFKRVVVCDVPGVIEGAHLNVGLGHAFLRHIRRCKILVIVVDMAGTEGREPWNDYRQILSELEQYDPELLTRPRLVVANKMDEAAAETKLRQFKRRVPRTLIVPMAAGFDVGVDLFKQTLREQIEALNTASDPSAPLPSPEFKPGSGTAASAPSPRASRRRSGR